MAAEVGPSLIQTKTERSKTAVHSAWATGPFGDCKPSCTGDGAYQVRNVQCESIFTGEKLSSDMCNHPRPSATQSCSCQHLACDSCQTALPEEPAEFELRSWGEVGCFQRSPGDSNDLDEAPSRDSSCLDWQGPGLCRSGLPFYRLRSNLMRPSECFNFCLDQGLDLFGLVETNSSALECRCGATPLNTQIWQQQPRPGLSRMDFSDASPIDAPSCPVRLFRYAGHYENHGIPAVLHAAFSSQDLSYVDSIAAGHYVHDIEDDMESDMESETTMKDFRQQLAMLDESQVPMWARNCWPDNCGPANYLWTERRQQPPGVSDNWEEYLTIRYWWGNGIDEGRKEAFRVAADRWRQQTCINLIETADPAWPWIRVEATQLDSCHVTNLGRPWPAAESLNYPTIINLGWCKDMRHLGSMIHEIGHAIGMNHEQKRADSSKAYFSRGPHLVIYWQNLGQWSGQFTAEETSYIGSADDGAGDAYSGYAPYDFESIMHYSPRNWFETIPSSARVLVGQRQDLSEGDILNALDMYQCKRKGSVGSTTTTTTSTTISITATITATTTTTTTTPTTTRTTTTTTPTTSVPTTTSTSAEPQMICQATALSLQFGGTDERCSVACNGLARDEWPCAGLCECTLQITTSRPSTSSTILSTTAASTTEGPSERTCTPTPGLPPNGATSSNCQQCADGYPWWPCNTNPAICSCTGR